MASQARRARPAQQSGHCRLPGVRPPAMRLGPRSLVPAAAIKHGARPSAQSQIGPRCAALGPSAESDSDERRRSVGHRAGASSHLAALNQWSCGSFALQASTEHHEHWHAYAETPSFGRARVPSLVRSGMWLRKNM